MQEDDCAAQAFASEADELRRFRGIGRDVEDVQRGRHLPVFSDFVKLAGDLMDCGGDVGGDGGAETGFFEGFVFVGRSLGVGVIGIGIAFAGLEVVEGEEDEGGAFHGWVHWGC